MPGKIKLAYLYLLLTALIWGAGIPVIKATGESIPPISFLSLRFGISAILAIPFAVLILKKYSLNKRRIKLILTASTIGHILTILFLFLGLNLTTSSEGSLITSLTPIIVSVMAYLILHETIKKEEIEGALIALIGTLIIILMPIINNVFHVETSGINIIGNILILIAILLDATYMIYVKKNISQDRIITPLVLIVFSFIFAGIVFLPLGIIEQYYLYRKSLNKAEMNANYCTSHDIDKSSYTNDYACDENGCFNITYKIPDIKPNIGEKVGSIDNREVESGKKDYFCIIEGFNKDPSFTNTLANNINKYLQLPTILGVLYMAIISGFLGYFLYQKGFTSIDAGEAALFMYLQPLFGIPLAIIFLGERIAGSFIFGAIIVLIGVIHAERNGSSFGKKD